MKIQDGHVVELEFTLKDDEGQVIDSSGDSGLWMYLHGHGQMLPGLERALEGKTVGDALHTVLSPEDAFGEREAGATMKVPRKDLPGDLEPEEGMQLMGVNAKGEHDVFFITKVAKDHVVLDRNHPLAGRTIHADVRVQTVREATEEELAHGHAHGPDGHHHH